MLCVPVYGSTLSVLGASFVPHPYVSSSTNYNFPSVLPDCMSQNSSHTVGALRLKLCVTFKNHPEKVLSHKNDSMNGGSTRTQITAVHGMSTFANNHHHSLTL